MATQTRRGNANRKPPKGTSWIDDALSKQFWKPERGRHRIRITGDVVKRDSQYGRVVYDIPTQAGTLTTSSFSVLRPLAQLAQKKKSIIGKSLSFVVKGEGIARRFTEVEVR